MSLDGFAELSDLWWPEDRSWVVGSDVDLASTCVGGTAALVAELPADPALEVFTVAPGDRVG
ncbi:hypothetical protein ABZT45_33160 [Streptomyces sp. NPDC005356]|uniref:hypothetical protein n=1 Tax=unclassified Streptomyces TaxID=2593676 RepID=UPI0033BE5C17